MMNAPSPTVLTRKDLDNVDPTKLRDMLRVACVLSGLRFRTYITRDEIVLRIDYEG